ncbi:antibiotic biosynthesis monooxygenase [Plesiomonas shigelloides]|uniref:antibiotic biosynthesis monooxygenase n=1 Tax=Plesiomonas shigelloides TaxID=703 RepID=UPI00387EEE8B
MEENHHIISSVISHKVIPGNEFAFEKLVEHLLHDTQSFAGFLGARVVRPDQVQPEFKVTFNFASREQYEAWLNSELRRRWTVPMEKLSTGSEVEIQRGQEIWFTLPELTSSRPPNRHKMVFLTWLAIYPSVQIFSYLIHSLHLHWVTPVIFLFITGLTVLFVSYLLLPWYTRLFKFWLWPTAQGKQLSHNSAQQKR